MVAFVGTERKEPCLFLTLPADRYDAQLDYVAGLPTQRCEAHGVI